uniref:Uncharacterized protein n=1 Tax=Arundo donax TaxID=35708 RepID=A0A0A9GUY6_ARUDO
MLGSACFDSLVDRILSSMWNFISVRLR